MAYSFNSSYFYTGTAATGSMPLTVAGLLNKTNLTTDGTICGITISAGSNPYLCLNARANNDTPDDNIAAQIANGVTTAIARSTGLLSAQWQSGAAVFTSTTSRSAYVDGGNKTTDTTNIGTTNLGVLTDTAIGVLRRNSGASAIFGGLLAEVAIWSVALTDDEIVSLSKGFKPSRIRPQSLVFYAPLVREKIETKQAMTLTASATAPTVANHPRVY